MGSGWGETAKSRGWGSEGEGKRRSRGPVGSAQTAGQSSYHVKRRGKSIKLKVQLIEGPPTFSKTEIHIGVNNRRIWKSNLRQLL